MKTFFLLLTLIRIDGIEIHHAVDTGMSLSDCETRMIEVRERIHTILEGSYTLSCEIDHE
jgi:hypothetical protein